MESEEDEIKSKQASKKDRTLPLLTGLRWPRIGKHHFQQATDHEPQPERKQGYCILGMVNVSDREFVQLRWDQ